MGTTSGPGPQQKHFAAYLEGLAGAAGHADRHTPLKNYCTALLLPGERKSVEPMAARLAPDNVRRMYQSLHHLVATARWRDEAVLAQVRSKEVRFQTKPEIALDQIRQTAEAGVARGMVLADAAYGTDSSFRAGLSELKLRYVVGVQSTATVWAPGEQPLAAKAWKGRGRLLRRDGGPPPTGTTGRLRR